MSNTLLSNTLFPILVVLNFLSEQQLDLPQCNSFYRMLAHRMADYYMLRHTLDPTGNAVRIHKTDFHRL